MRDFDISYSLGSPPGLSNEDENIWSFNQCSLYPSANGTVLAQPKGDSKPVLLQREVADALLLCRPFRSLTSHVDEIVTHIPGLKEHRADTLKTLDDLTRSGLLEPGVAAWQRLTSSDGEVGAESCGVCVLTCDRPEALERILMRLCQTKLPEQIDKIWVIDDSRNNDSIKNNAELVRKFSRECSVELVHFDVGLREKLLTHLTSLLPDAAESINWLISRRQWGTSATYGQARNLALLLNVGKRILMLDDDIIPEAICPPVASEGIRISTDDPRELFLWESKESLRSHALSLKESPLKLMLASLGKQAGTLLSSANGNWKTLRGADGELLAAYNGTSPIAISQCGYWGDPGSDIEHPSMFNFPLNNLTSTLEKYKELGAVMGARAAWSGARNPTLSPHATMSAVTGVDHSLLLPPYLPAGRGEDIMFGIMVQRIHPNSLVLNEGWAVPHQPIEKRTGPRSLARESVSLGLSTLCDWIGRKPMDLSGLSERDRLSSISEQILSLTERDQSACESLAVQELASLKALRLKKCMEHIDRLQTQEHLAGYGEWRSCLESSRDNLLSQISDSDSTPINTYLDSHAINFERLRHEGRTFAYALQQWPSVCEASAEFSEKNRN